jgi:O-antigen/teichoic acid export membrane protein
MLGVMIVRGVILPPIALTYIDHDLLGAWYASGNIVNLLLITEGGVWLFFRQRTAFEYGRQDYKSLSQLIGSCSLWLIIIGIVIALAGIAIAPLIPSWFNVNLPYSEDLSYAFTLTVIGTGLSFPSCIPRAVSHGLQRQIFVNVNQLISELLSLFSSIWLIIDGQGVVALGIGPLIREFVLNILNWPVMFFQMNKLNIIPTISINHFKRISKQIGWTFLMNINRVLRRNVDALIVSQIFGNSAVLIFEWTKRAWELFASILSQASSAFTPGIAHLQGEGDTKKLHYVTSKLFGSIAIALAFIFGLGIRFNTDFIRLWVGSQFYAGDTFNILFGLSTVTFTISFMLSEALFSIGKIRSPAIAQFLFSIVRLIIAFSLFPTFGLLAIPLSFMFSDTFGDTIYLIKLWNRHLKVPERETLKQLVIVFRSMMAALFTITLWQFFPAAYSWVALILNGTIFCLSVLIVLFFTEPLMRDTIIKIYLKMKHKLTTAKKITSNDN